MRELSKAKWFIASCGFVCLATFLALSLQIAGKPATPIGKVSQVSRSFRDGAVPHLRSASAGNSNVIKRYAQLPLAFEPNVSSSSNPAKFLARGKGYALFLANHEAVPRFAALPSLLQSYGWISRAQMPIRILLPSKNCRARVITL